MSVQAHNKRDTTKSLITDVAAAITRLNFCATGLHRKGTVTPNASKSQWEVVCDACGAVTEWWAYGTPRIPRAGNVNFVNQPINGDEILISK